MPTAASTRRASTPPRSRSASSSTRCSTTRSAEAFVQRLGPRDERVAVVARELLPGREGARVAYPVEEQHPVEVVELVLEGAGGQALARLLALGAVAVEPSHADAHVALDLAAQVRDRQAALVDRRRLLAERLDHRVDGHGERHGRLVRVARGSG